MNLFTAFVAHLREESMAIEVVHKLKYFIFVTKKDREND